MIIKARDMSAVPVWTMIPLGALIRTHSMDRGVIAHTIAVTRRMQMREGWRSSTKELPTTAGYVAGSPQQHARRSSFTWAQSTKVVPCSSTILRLGALKIRFIVVRGVHVSIHVPMLLAELK
mmetsp:Transcript_27475/g.44102  ORF Transcript_27475/g.44102 Transcript_27475/m.44102 type:complete len:122 (-) Transcript_27475:73-438(-)